MKIENTVSTPLKIQKTKKTQKLPKIFPPKKLISGDFLFFGGKKVRVIFIFSRGDFKIIQ